jgi:hypothetical protein
LYKGGRASTSQINFSTSNMVYKRHARTAEWNASCRLHSVTNACVDNASCRVENAQRVANASKRDSRNARVVCSIVLYRFCKTKRSAALQTPRFQRSCRISLIVCGATGVTCHKTVRCDRRLSVVLQLQSPKWPSVIIRR